MLEMSLLVYFYFHYIITNEYPTLNNVSYKKVSEISNKVLNHFRNARYRDFDVEKIYFPGLGRGNLGTFPITQDNMCIIMVMNFDYPTIHVKEDVIIATLYKLLPQIFEPIYLNNTEINMGYFVKVQFTNVHLLKYEWT